MDVQLVVANGSKSGQVIPIRGPKFFIGRAEDCHLKPRSELVSRHHCVIMIEGDYIAVRDFGSKNGTFINGEQVVHEQEIKSGDKLAVGQLEFDVKLDVRVGGEKKPKVKNVQEAVARTVETAAPVASASNPNDPDLDNWLQSGDEPEESSEETRTIEVGQYVPSSDTTESLAASEETVTPTPEPVAEPEKKTEPKRVDAEHKSPAKIPKSTKANSRDAAADALKNFFRGR